MKFWSTVLFVTLTFTVGCSDSGNTAGNSDSDSDTDQGASDADASDAGNMGSDRDATASDAGSDAATADASVDLGADAGVDIGADASVDLGADAGMDIGGPQLSGCMEVLGNRPASTGNIDAPRIGNGTLGIGAAGEPLSGIIEFDDSQDDEVDVIVQINGEDVHYVCTLDANDLTDGTYDLSHLVLGNDAEDGSYLIYIALRDAAGNVSGYLVTTLIVGNGGSVDLCNRGAATPIQLTGKAPSDSTAFYTAVNGTHPEYLLGPDGSGGPLTIVYQAQFDVSMGACTQLPIAGDSTGTDPVGWDNCLVVQIRDDAASSIVAEWYYCSPDTTGIYHEPSMTQLTEARAADVAGDQLDPAIPSSMSFGHATSAIDLMDNVPEGMTDFHLTLLILDWGNVGSTTDVWAFPQ